MLNNRIAEKNLNYIIICELYYNIMYNQNVSNYILIFDI